MYAPFRKIRYLRTEAFIVYPGNYADYSSGWPDYISPPANYLVNYSLVPAAVMPAETPWTGNDPGNFEQHLTDYDTQTVLSVESLPPPDGFTFSTHGVSQYTEEWEGDYELFYWAAGNWGLCRYVWQGVLINLELRPIRQVGGSLIPLLPPAFALLAPMFPFLFPLLPFSPLGSLGAAVSVPNPSPSKRRRKKEVA
jgi:hypothetical protein